MEKIIIGVVAYPSLDIDNDRCFVMFSNVIEMIVKHGAIPLGIFPTQKVNYQDDDFDKLPHLTEEEKEDLETEIKKCDAIIKPGALKLYEYDRYIYEYCLFNNVPFLGICGGMQIMAAHGKTEIRNIKVGNSERHQSKEKYAHPVRVVKGTLLHDILGKDEIMVNSRHSYMIPDAGIHTVSAISDDGVIEAIENEKADFNMGVQWHPEGVKDDNSDKIFESLIGAAKSYRMRKDRRGFWCLQR